MKHPQNETIVAIATPLGMGGVGVVRLSGNKAQQIASFLLKDFPKTIEPRRIYHGWIVEEETVVDEILYYFMAGPKSYTGEDIIELHCHGGIAVLRKVMGMTVKGGARIARPGEFTQRAFINGKMDLVQAEAVLDLVAAQTTTAAGYAVRQLEGRLSDVVSAIKGRLMELLTQIEGETDFPEDIAEMGLAGLSKRIVEAKEEIDKLYMTAEAGRLFREGISAIIIGKPNTGKSSLLNALLEEERAIVTDVPGTTRDTIEELINIEGLPVKIIDSAGVSGEGGKVEAKGVERTRKELEAADLALIVFDASRPLDAEDKAVAQMIEDKPNIAVINKSDLLPAWSEKDLDKIIRSSKRHYTSALYKKGINELKGGLLDYVEKRGAGAANSSVLINERHRECLRRASEALDRARDTCKNERPVDLVSIDLKGAIIALGEMTGELVSDEVIERIFSRFCVGK